MNRYALAAGFALSVLAFPGAGRAGPGAPVFQWRQTLNMPKRANLPPDAKVDILGIELGDTLLEARAKLAKLRVKYPPQERMTIYQDSTGTIAPKESAYVSDISLSMDRMGTGNSPIQDTVIVYFSAPASGSQVIGVRRLVYYHNNPADEPRISDILNQISSKVRGNPEKGARVYGTNYDLGDYYFVFDDGQYFRRVGSYSAAQSKCDANIAEQWQMNANPTGKCDIVYKVIFNHGPTGSDPGISPDHAHTIQFVLSDNERTWRNRTADGEFFNAYVQDMKSRGAAIRL
jgi:hypothetical protein